MVNDAGVRAEGTGPKMQRPSSEKFKMKSKSLRNKRLKMEAQVRHSWGTRGIAPSREEAFYNNLGSLTSSDTLVHACWRHVNRSSDDDRYRRQGAVLTCSSDHRKVNDDRRICHISSTSDRNEHVEGSVFLNQEIPMMTLFPYVIGCMCFTLSTWIATAIYKPPRNDSKNQQEKTDEKSAFDTGGEPIHGPSVNTVAQGTPTGGSWGGWRRQISQTSGPSLR